MHIQGILLPKHTYIYTCISKVFSLPKHTYIYFVRYDNLLSLRLFYLSSKDHEKLGVSYYDLRNKVDQITIRDLKVTRLPPSSASLTS